MYAFVARTIQLVDTWPRGVWTIHDGDAAAGLSSRWRWVTGVFVCRLKPTSPPAPSRFMQYLLIKSSSTQVTSLYGHKPAAFACHMAPSALDTPKSARLGDAEALPTGVAASASDGPSLCTFLRCASASSNSSGLKNP